MSNDFLRTTAIEITYSRLINELASIMIEQDDVLLSYDVLTPFTNTPINETLENITKRLEDDTELKLWTDLHVDDIMELLKFILRSLELRDLI